MTKLITLVLFVVVTFAAFPAFASDMSVIVTVDQARLDREMGHCDGGRSVAVHFSRLTRRSPPGVTGYSAEVPSYDMMAGMLRFDVALFCGDRQEISPIGNGVEVVIRNH